MSESIAARPELQKRNAALRLMRNFFASRSGASVNRAGTKFVSEVKNSAQTVDGSEVEFPIPEQLIPFIYNSSTAYVLEFGHQYIRLHRNGLPVFVAPSDWVSITAYTTGDTVRRFGTDYYCILDNTNEPPESEPDYWYEMAAAPSWYTGAETSYLEIPTPYQAGEITMQQVAQSADILTITRRNHAPRELRRISATKWVLADIDYQPSLGSPELLSSSTTGASQVTWNYVVTAIDKSTGEESIVSHRKNGYTEQGVVDTDWGAANKAIEAIGADDVLIDNGAPHNLDTGNVVYISDCSVVAGAENTALVALLEGKTFRITVDPLAAANKFYLDDTAGFTYGTAHQVTWHRTWAAVSGPEALGKIRHNLLSWTPIDGALEYWIYKGDTGQAFGFIGNSVKPTFRDTGFEPDYESSPPLHITRFTRDDRHPHTAGYFQQRLVFGQSILEPQGVWMSRTGAFKNFSTRQPLEDTDPISFAVVGQRVNEVRHLIGMDQLLILTLGNEQAVEGDESGVVRPDAINMRVHGYNGASNLRPVEIGNDALYVQARGSIVRSLAFDAVREAYNGGDMTLFASHLVDAHQLVDWAFALVPHSLLWTVREDGVLLGLTYIREQEVLGWHQHTTHTSDATVQSVIKSVAVIPEDGVDILYWIVERVINGGTVRYVEKMMKRCTSWEGL